MSSSEQRRLWRSARAQRQLRHIVLGPLPDVRENPLDQRRVRITTKDNEVTGRVFLKGGGYDDEVYEKTARGNGA